MYASELPIFYTNACMLMTHRVTLLFNATNSRIYWLWTLILKEYNEHFIGLYLLILEYWYSTIGRKCSRNLPRYVLFCWKRMFVAACKRIDSGQCYMVCPDKNQPPKPVVYFEAIRGLEVYTKIRKTLQRITFPRNMKYKCGSVDKGREVALDPLL